MNEQKIFFEGTPYLHRSTYGYVTCKQEGRLQTLDRGPKDPRTGDQRTQSHEGCVALQQLQCNLTNLQTQPHGYVLYVIAMHANGIIYSKQHYFKLSSDLFDPKLCHCDFESTFYTQKMLFTPVVLFSLFTLANPRIVSLIVCKTTRVTSCMQGPGVKGFMQIVLTFSCFVYTSWPLQKRCRLH